MVRLAHHERAHHERRWGQGVSSNYGARPAPPPQIASALCGASRKDRRARVTRGGRRFCRCEEAASRRGNLGWGGCNRSCERTGLWFDWLTMSGRAVVAARRAGRTMSGGRCSTMHGRPRRPRLLRRSWRRFSQRQTGVVRRAHHERSAGGGRGASGGRGCR